MSATGTANTKKIVSDLVDHTGNPAPLGLFGFALTTILLNLHNAGLIEMSSMIISMGLFYGGIAQVFAGYMEWKKGNTFGTTAFLSYGLFWLSLVSLWIMPTIGLSQAPSLDSMGAYLLLWGIFTLGLFVATFKHHASLQVVFALLVVLFFLLAAADFSGNPSVKMIAGYEGILCGISAFYTGMAQVINDAYKKSVLPV